MKIKLDDFKKQVVDYYAAAKPDLRITEIKIDEKCNSGFVTSDWFNLKIEGTLGEKPYAEILKRDKMKKIIEHWLQKEDSHFVVSNVILDSEGINAITKERNAKITSSFTNRFFSWRN